MRLSDFLDELGRPIAYYPKLAIFLGSVNAAVLLCQLFYWEGKQDDKEGWIFKTQKEITEETGLSRRESDTARGILRQKLELSDGRKVAILTDRLRGVPPKINFLLDRNALDDLWDEWRNPPNQDGGKRQIDLARSATTERRKTPNQDGEISQNNDHRSLPETTREHTHTSAPSSPTSQPSLLEGVCVLPDLTFEDYQGFARSKPSFTAPDAWAMKHYPLRDADALVTEWMENRKPEKIAEARAATPNSNFTFHYALQIIGSMREAHGSDPVALISEMPLDDDVRKRLLEKFRPQDSRGEAAS